MLCVNEGEDGVMLPQAQEQGGSQPRSCGDGTSSLLRAAEGPPSQSECISIGEATWFVFVTEPMHAL